ncbi:MAG: hypothetical protein EXX96DRAFT_582111 [Benjaminiella poitrasii]|nr:MAG: hypothetical protein EXX96DRAFT_582111 [Benjaminiella poitrasii]
MQAKRKSLTQQNLRPPSLRKKKEAIDCICDSPHEEFGSMVQCDDCYRWLHLDCLELNQESLEEETFRCPSCFLSLGSCTNDKNSKLLSSITWRYAAQWKSRRIAALNQGMTDDEFDDDIEDHMDLDESMSLSDLEDETPSLPTTTTMITTTTESIIPTSSIMSSSSTTPSSSPPPLHFDDDGYSTDLPGPETPTDWPDMLSESRYSSTSSQETSEATTPNETLYSTDPFEFKDENMLILDPESLEILSRLALLQSLESVRKGLFAPNATDVFLGENLSKNSIVPNMMTSQAVHRYAANVPPSAICSQDLSEFSFDSGPFWEPLL